MLSVIVDGLWREGDKSLAVRLVAEDGNALPAWQPGAHIDVHLPCGAVRQYSLTGACGDESYLICVGRETASRGGSRYVHETLRPGQKLTISAPRNLFPLHQADRVLLLAAGIGITPLYAMALQLKAAGTPFTLHYYVKRRESAAFARELSRFGECQIHTASPRRRWQNIFRWLSRGFTPGSAVRQGLWKKCETWRRPGDGMMAIFTARRFSPRPLPHAVTQARSLRSNSPRPGSAGRCPRIRPSLRYYRKMAWTCRFHAKWGSAGRA